MTAWRSVLMASLIAALLAGCSPVGAGGSVAWGPARPSVKVHPNHLRIVNGKNATITVYASEGSLIKTISKGLVAPFAMTFDDRGDMAVANGDDAIVYESGATEPAKTYKRQDSSPAAVAFDPTGRLAIAWTDHSLRIYDVTGQLVRTIQEVKQNVTGLVWDAGDNLYYAGTRQVNVYADGESKPFETIPIRGVDIDAISVDRYSGDLAIATEGSLKFYPAHATEPSYTVENGFKTIALAMDYEKNVYIISLGDNAIREYSESGKLDRTVGSVSFPMSFAIDSRENLWVGDGQTNTVKAYPPDSGTPFLTITDGIDGLASIAFPPPGSPNF